LEVIGKSQPISSLSIAGRSVSGRRQRTGESVRNDANLVHMEEVGRVFKLCYGAGANNAMLDSITCGSISSYLGRILS
jgi:hypothetical protein